MRNFKFKDGNFEFTVFTDDNSAVAVKLHDDADQEFVGISKVKGDDKFDLHLGMHIAIRQCMLKMKSSFMQDLNRLAKQVTNSIKNMKYFDRETFQTFRAARLKKIEKQNAKKSKMEN